MKQPEVAMMTIQATPNELIALGHVLTLYLNNVERAPHTTKDQLEIVALLRCFQGRFVSYTNQQLTTPAGMRGRQR